MVRKRYFRDFKNIGCLLETSVLAFIVIFALGIYDFIIPMFIEGFKVTPFIIGLTVSLTYVASFLFETPIGAIVDKYGRRETLAVGLAGLSIIGLVYYFSRSIVDIALLALIFGVFSLAFWVPSSVLVRESSPKKCPAMSFGIYLTSCQLGWILGPILASFVAFYFSMKYNFLIIAALMFIGLVYTVAVVRKKKIAKHTLKLVMPSKIYLRYARMHKHSIPLYFLSMSLSIWIGLEWVFVQLASENVFHFNKIVIGLLLGAMMAIEGLLYISSGFFMDKVGKHWIIIAGFFLLYTSTYLAFLSVSAAQFIFCMLIAAGAVAWIFPGCEAVLTDIAPEDELGEMTSVFDSSKDLGLVIGPTVGGALVTYFGNYMAPFLLISIIAAISSFVAVMIRKKR